MTPTPILKVHSTLQKNQVKFLLVGGQACVFYGGAEFSRDVDIADRLYWAPLRPELEQLRRGRTA